MEFPKIFIEQTFCQIIQGAKVKKNNFGKLLIQGSCPFCNDGKSKNPRFYLYEKKGKFNVGCKNCNYGKSFNNFLKTSHPDMYDDLARRCLDSFKSGELFKSHEKVPYVKITPSVRIHSFFKFFFEKTCIPLTVPQSTPRVERARQYAMQYILGRNIKKECYEKYFLCMKGRFNIRVIIPFINKDGYYYNFQARDIHPKPDETRKNKKYLFAQFDKIELPDDKIYKQYLVDTSKTVYICEGIIDSEFIDNSIALCGVDLGNDFQSDRARVIFSNIHKRIWCVDNPFLDSAAYNTIVKLLEHGETCFIFPKEYRYSCKDINDLCLKLNVDTLDPSIIHDNCISGKAGLYKLKLLELCHGN